MNEALDRTDPGTLELGQGGEPVRRRVDSGGVGSIRLTVRRPILLVTPGFAQLKWLMKELARECCADLTWGLWCWTLGGCFVHVLIFERVPWFRLLVGR